MAVNRVDYNNNTLIDLTSDTVTAADLPAGVTAHDRSGTPITGTANYQPRTLDSSVTIGAETETTVEGAIGELADLVPSTAAPATNKLATAGDVNGEEITVTASTSPVSTASGSLRKIAIFGKSEVVDGGIHSEGEGWATVDLGSLEWGYETPYQLFYAPVTGRKTGNINILCAKYFTTGTAYDNMPDKSCRGSLQNTNIYIRDTDYTDTTAFKNSLNGVILAYQLADPTQGNTIAAKTDDGSGTDGTMATFSTGTPLRGIPDTDVRDVMEWDGSAGEVTKNCNVLNMGGLTWNKTDKGIMYSNPMTEIKRPADRNKLPNIVNPIYTPDTDYNVANLTTDKTIAIGNDFRVYVYDTDYTDATAFKTAMSGVKLVYELATPTTEQFTASENTSFAALQTYSPQTAVAINDNPEFEFEAYAGTANGKVVADIQTDLQGQIDGINSQVNKNLSETEILAQVNDRIYQGTDLTVKFADEISASPYNGDPWAWIKARIQAENFVEIHVCDYIPITTTNSVTLNAQIAGINTYKYYGDSAVGSHIDFICKEPWPTLHPVNPVNFNNGTAAENSPWLASDLYLYLNSLAGTVPSAAEVGGGEGTAVDYTEDGVYYYLPTQLKNVIVEKRFLLPTRYSASGLLTDDNSWAWKNIGKLWLPDECEVYGMPVWGGNGGYSLGGSDLQYPLFAGNMNRLKFRNGGRYAWWLLSPCSGNSTYWCLVYDSGNCYYASASNSGIAAPVCFRVG